MTTLAQGTPMMDPRDSTAPQAQQAAGWRTSHRLRAARPHRGLWGIALLLVAGMGVEVAWASPSSKAATPLLVVDGAWIRPAVPGQQATGGYMRLTAARDLSLVGFSTPVAAEAQLHEMAMVGDVMTMREARPVALPAGQVVALQPGNGQRHLMLMGLRKPLKEGDQVRLTLKLRTPAGQALTQVVSLPVRKTAPAP